MQQSSIAGWLTKDSRADRLGSSSSAAPINDGCSVKEVQEEQISVDSQITGNRNQAAVRKNGTIPFNVTIEPCTDRHIVALRRLNALMLPIPYQDKFYREILDDPVTAGITRLAFWHDPENLNPPNPGKLVAAIRCRLLTAVPNEPTIQSPTLYISTIATLSPYRNQSIACSLLAVVMRHAILEHGIKSVTAHVWEANPDGLEWYQRRGFNVLRREENYYPRLAPQSAGWVICRDVLPSDVIQYPQP